MKAPVVITPSWVKQAYPQLVVIERTPHELDVSSPVRAETLLTLRFAHADASAEGVARWANSKQVFRRGQVTETTPFADEDEPDTWTASFEEWAASWLELLASGGRGPVRPGRG